MKTEACQALADETRWHEWLQDGLPESLRAHADQCADCAAIIRDLEGLGQGFGAMAAETAAWADSFDLTESVLQASEPRSGRAWGPWLAGALAAAAAILFAVWPASSGFEVDSEAGASWRGRTLKPGVTQVFAPGRLLASLGRAQVRGDDVQANLPRNSALDIEGPGAFSGLVGTVRFHSTQPFVVRGSTYRLEAAGQIEVAEGDEEIAKMVSRKGVLGSAAVVALVYAGWGSLQSGSSEVRGQAPVVLAIDAAGKVSSSPLDAKAGSVGRGRPGVAVSASGGQALRAAGAAGQDEAAEPSSGAYWSEDEQALRFAIQGEVIDSVSGEPVSDFTVRAQAKSLQGYGPEHHELSRTRKAQGKFRLVGLSAGTWRITARAKGYAPVSQVVDLQDVGTDPYVVLPLSSGARLSGQVVDARKRPVAEARVGLVACFGAKGHSLKTCDLQTTGADGRFTLQGVPADAAFAVRAEHPRHGFVVQPGLRRSEGESEHIVLELSGRLRVYGEVTRGPDKTPQPGVRVVNGDESVSTLTDAQGAYTMIVPLENRAKVHVVVPGTHGADVKFGSYPERRSSEAVRWVQAEGYVAEVQKDFWLAVDSARLFGQITDDAGAPVGGVSLRLWNTTGWHKGRRGHQTFPERTTTDAQGRYSIEGVPAQAGYTMAYISEDGTKTDLGYVNVKSSQPVQADFQIGRGRIRGRFVDSQSGEPFRLSRQGCGSMFGAERLGPQGYFVAPRCLEDGRFEFEQLPPGDYRLHAKMGWLESTVKFEATDVSVGPGQVQNEVLVPVSGAQADEWTFRVLDDSGRFVPSLYLRMLAKNRSYTSSLGLGSDGLVKVTINRSFDEVFIDAQGYESAKVRLKGREPGALIELRMRRVKSEGP